MEYICWTIVEELKERKFNAVYQRIYKPMTYDELTNFFGTTLISATKSCFEIYIW